MAEETQTQGSPSADDIESPDFNWGAFFAEEAAQGAPTPVTTPQAQQSAPAPQDDDFEAPDDTTVLKNQIVELQKMVADTAKVTREMSTTAKVTAAVEAWKQQASPAELQMADVLSEATSLEDLQAKAALVKRVASGADKMIAAQKVAIEQEMQKEFGLPITPTYDPIPEREKLDQALADGDIAAASAIAMKGVFS